MGRVYTKKFYHSLKDFVASDVDEDAVEGFRYIRKDLPSGVWKITICAYETPKNRKYPSTELAVLMTPMKHRDDVLLTYSLKCLAPIGYTVAASKEIVLETARLYVGNLHNFENWRHESSFSTGADGLVGEVSEIVDEEKNLAAIFASFSFDPNIVSAQDAVETVETNFQNL